MKQTSAAGVAVDVTDRTASDIAAQPTHPRAPAVRDLRGFWRRALALLVPVPMLALVAGLVVMPYPVRAHTARAMAAAAADPRAAQASLWLSVIFALTVVPATMAVAWAGRRRAPWLTLAAGVSLLVALSIGLPNTDLAIVTAARRGLDPALVTTLNDAVAAQVAVRAGTVLFMIGQSIGFVLLGIALWRARVLPAWLGLVLAASGPAHIIPQGGNAGAAASWAMTAIGYAGVAVALWRTPNTDFDLAPVAREPAEATAEPAIDHGRDARTAWRWLLAIVAVPVPIFVAVFRYLLPYRDGDTPAEIFAQLVAATTCQSAVIWIGSAVVVCGFAGALAVAWLTRRRTPVLTTIAMLLAVPGYIALFAGGSYGDVLAYVTGTVAGVDHETAFQLGFGMESSAQSSALGTIFVAGHLFGTILLGLALWRARIAPTWLAVGLAVSQPIHLASVMTGIRPIDLLGWGLTAAGFAWAAWRLAKLPNDDFDLPPIARKRGTIEGWAHRRSAMRSPMPLALILVVLAACGGGPTASPVPTATTVVSPATGATAAVPTNPPATPIPGCLPQCWTGRLMTPGPLAGDYATSYFFGGQFTVTVPEGWYGYEDSTGELAIGPEGREDARLEFWIDVYAASDPPGKKDSSIEATADGITAWFVDKPIIDVIERQPTMFGGLPAESIEYQRKASAATEDPDCPAEIQPCAVEFGYPEWDGAFSEGDAFHSRLVVLKASWGGQVHAVYAMFWAIGPAYDELIDEARAVVDGAKLPEGVRP